LAAVVAEVSLIRPPAQDRRIRVTLGQVAATMRSGTVFAMKALLVHKSMHLVS
jgi:hypothetical protein